MIKFWPRKKLKKMAKRKIGYWRMAGKIKMKYNEWPWSKNYNPHKIGSRKWVKKEYGDIF